MVRRRRGLRNGKEVLLLLKLLLLPSLEDHSGLILRHLSFVLSSLLRIQCHRHRVRVDSRNGRRRRLVRSSATTIRSHQYAFRRLRNLKRTHEPSLTLYTTPNDPSPVPTAVHQVSVSASSSPLSPPDDETRTHQPPYYDLAVPTNRTVSFSLLVGPDERGQNDREDEREEVDAM